MTCNLGKRGMSINYCITNYHQNNHFICLWFCGSAIWAGGSSFTLLAWGHQWSCALPGAACLSYLLMSYWPKQIIWPNQKLNKWSTHGFKYREEQIIDSITLTTYHNLLWQNTLITVFGGSSGCSPKSVASTDLSLKC